MKKLIIIFSTLFVFLFFLGCTEQINFTLIISEQLNPNVSIVISDKYFNPISFQEIGEYIILFPVGIDPETKYTFRLTSADGNIVVPPLYVFTSNEVENTGRNQYQQVQCNFSEGTYVVELIQLDGNEGVIISRKNIIVKSKAFIKIQNDIVLSNYCKGVSKENLDNCFNNLLKINDCDQLVGSNLDWCLFELKEMLTLIEVKKTCSADSLSKECVLRQLQEINCFKEDNDDFISCIQNYVSQKLNNDVDQFCPIGDQKAECIKNLAKDTNIVKYCEIISDSIFEEICYNEVAISAEDVSFCRGMPKSIGGCRAMIFHDWTECQKIVCDFSCNFENLETQKDLCLQGYGISTRDINVCMKVKNDDFRYFCIGLVNKDLDACRKMTIPEYVESCVSQVSNNINRN